VDSAWGQRKLEARKMLENGAESLASSARFVGQFYICKAIIAMIMIQIMYVTTLNLLGQPI